MSPDAERLGKMLLERGLLSQEEYDEAMALHRTSDRALPEILTEKNFLSVVQLQDAIASLDKRVRFCPRCNVPVYVTRIMAEGERCPRCLTKVVWQEESVVAQIRDLDSMIQLTKDDLPADVQEARRLPGRLFGKYILVQEIGRGGAGIVHKAWDTMLGEYVALKFIRETKELAGSPDAAQRIRREQILDLLQEARAALRLRHEHIVSIRDIGRVEQQYFIAMDYIEGQTLAEHLKTSQTRGRLSPLYEDPAFYLGVVRDVANAIHYAHTFPKPIVHCDLKPGNVLISRLGAPYVMDFGLARVVGRERPDGAEEEKIRGTPAYMAPEQLTPKGGGIGPWTDIYALGAVLYELMTGRQVFVGETLEVMLKAMRETPERPTKVVGKTEEVKRHESTKIILRLSKLEEICLRCLAKEPKDRYATARQVSEDLVAVLEAVQSGQDSGILPPKLQEAQARSEIHKVDTHITRFDLDRAMEEAEAVEKRRDDTRVRDRLAERRRELALLEKLRARLVTRLNAERPTFPAFQLIGGTLDQVELMKATAKKLYILRGEEPSEVEWSELSSRQVVEMAEAMRLGEPEDLLGLGILCHRSKLLDLAIRYLTSLKGTPLEQEARQILETSA